MPDLAEDIAALRSVIASCDNPRNLDFSPRITVNGYDLEALRRLLSRVEGMERVVEAARAWVKDQGDSVVLDRELCDAVDALPPAPEGT